MLLPTLNVLHLHWSPHGHYIWWDTSLFFFSCFAGLEKNHCLFLVLRSWMNFWETEELLCEDLVIVTCNATTGTYVGSLRHFYKKEDDGEGEESPSDLLFRLSQPSPLFFICLFCLFAILPISVLFFGFFFLLGLSVAFSRSLRASVPH